MIAPDAEIAMGVNTLFNSFRQTFCEPQGEAEMLLLRSGFGLAASLGVALALVAVTALAEEIVLKPPRVAAEVIRGYGGPDGLDEAGIRNYVALTRAEARASALTALIRADLDGDGAVTGEEGQIYQDSLSARARARFGRQFELADLNADQGLSKEEVSTAAVAAGLGALDGEEEASLLGLLALDGDGNGAINLDELREGLARASLPQNARKKGKDA